MGEECDLIIPAQLSALIVDDNDYARALAKQNLEQLGIGTIYQASDGATGLQIYKANKVDFVLLDWYMPEINGAGFTRLVRSECFGREHQPAIIIITAYATRENLNRIRELGLSEILIKPFDNKQLSQAVIDVLGQTTPGDPDKTNRPGRNQVLV
ncbi:hypothetical protein MNBD_ALPHA12-2080 [hydrothermal vent metagenome]|uniref:Response regulatory domain-containing protein n=1 Tax=hydrothermal vent metagenome TaxID=652676 RepID=A0A3B0U6N1_9ZZZZ